MRVKQNLIHTLIICLIAMLIPMTASAAGKTKKMTTYWRVLKEGNTVFCNNGYGIYKVNLKNNKVRKLHTKRIRSAGDEALESMKKKGKYLYYVYSNETTGALYRINLKTGKNEALTSHKYDGFEGYAISGNKIYYKIYHWSDESTRYKVMKLNGRSKKYTKVKVSCKWKKNNKAAKGYNLIISQYYNYGYHYKSWLKLPNGNKIYLGKITL